MPGVSQAEIVQRLHQRVDNVRNICILAHVDHGKTSLSDTLISSNGIISNRLAGQIRYLDNRPDEQQRQITMKSSSIALLYMKKGEQQGEKGVAHLINVIDSPGHVDFSAEVSAAVRVSDGALVLIDAVEGLCIQTTAVLRQAWSERVRPCLVINKIDRLITELQCEPQEAYRTIENIIGQVNALVSTFVTQERMEKGNDEDTEDQFQGFRWSREGFNDDPENFFSPERNNVIFCSAIDGFAFTIGTFATFFAKRLGMSENALQKCLWGDFTFSKKEKKVYRISKQHKGSPMFVQFILETLWKIYDCFRIHPDQEKKEQVVKSLNLSVPVHELRNRDDRFALKSVFIRWIPLADNVLHTVCNQCCSPKEAQKLRLETFFPKPVPEVSLSDISDIWKEKFSKFPPGRLDDIEQVEEKVAECDKDSETAENVAFVVKVLRIPRIEMPESRDDALRTITKPKLLSREERARLNAERIARNTKDEAEEEEETVSTKSAMELSATIENHQDNDSSRSTSNTLESSESKPPSAAADAQSSNTEVVREQTKDVAVEESANQSVLGGRRRRKINWDDLTDDAEDPSTVTTTVYFTATASTSASTHTQSTTTTQSAPSEKRANSSMSWSDFEGDAADSGTSASSTPDVLVGVCRVFSGTLRRGDRVYVLSPGYRPTAGGRGVSTDIITGLYILMGRELERVEEVPAGNICGIVCTNNTLATAVTVSSTLLCRSLVNMYRAAVPIIRVAIEPEDPRYVRRVEQGLLELAQTDSAVEVEVQDSGEHVLLASGEVHLERCISDLRDMFIRIPFRVSDPIVSFRETIVDEAPSEKALELAGLSKEDLVGRKSVHPIAGDACIVTIEPLAMPNALIAVVESATQLLRGGRKRDMSAVARLESRVNAVLDECGGIWPSLKGRIWTIGPRKLCTNMLVLDASCSCAGSSEWTDVFSRLRGDSIARSEIDTSRSLTLADIDNGITTGFQLSCTTGPLCDEPLHGVAFLITSIELRETSDVADVSGMMISSAKAAFRKAFLSRACRLVEPVLLCEIQASSEALGSTYPVLYQRRARIISEELKEGTPLFVIKAYMPVLGSFGFAEVLRKKTSGAAIPQLVFDHWEMMEQDPFYQPTTEEELEEFGEENVGNSPNYVRSIVDAVRKRKGLAVETQVVEHAEKQRTLARK